MLWIGNIQGVLFVDAGVIHKRYDVREPIEIRILPNRIEIVSHPGADRSISEEGLRTYRVFNRRYRNRRIGDFLKEMQENGTIKREGSSRKGYWVVL